MPTSTETEALLEAFDLIAPGPRVVAIGGGAGLARALEAVLVGGGPIPPGLLEEAAGRGMPALPSYGMTETCGQVATLRPGAPRQHAYHVPGFGADGEPA